MRTLAGEALGAAASAAANVVMNRVAQVLGKGEETVANAAPGAQTAVQEAVVSAVGPSKKILSLDSVGNSPSSDVLQRSGRNAGANSSLENPIWLQPIRGQIAEQDWIGVLDRLPESRRITIIDGEQLAAKPPFGAADHLVM